MIKFAACMEKLCKFHIFFTSRPLGRPYFWSKYRLNTWCSIEKKTRIIFGRTWNSNIYKKTIYRNPDVLILGGFFEITHFFLYIWAVKRRKKIIVFSEPFWNPPIGHARKYWQKKIIAQFFVRFLYCKIDAILSVGEGTKYFFTNYIGIPESKVHAVTYPVDLENHIKHPLRLGKGYYTFLFPHRLVSWYNPIMSLRWYLEIEKEFPNTRLIFNSHGYLRKDLEKLITEANMTSKISFADGISNWDDMADIYKISDIMLSTKSVSESSEWSVAEIEALGSGMGVIAFRNSKGLVDSIEVNNSGFIINSIDDLSEVVKAAKKYISDEKILYEHGRINKSIAKKFSTEEMSLRYMDIVNNLYE